jgi:archaellum component FlaF (FlaF/FlaG flagellin family)
VWLPVDRFSPTTSIAVVISGGASNYTVQHTLDDVLNSSATPTAFNHATLNGLAVSQDGNYAFPLSAIRVVNNSGAGTTTITIIQTETVRG